MRSEYAVIGQGENGAGVARTQGSESARPRCVCAGARPSVRCMWGDDEMGGMSADLVPSSKFWTNFDTLQEGPHTAHLVKTSFQPAIFAPLIPPPSPRRAGSAARTSQAAYPRLLPSLSMKVDYLPLGWPRGGHRRSREIKLSGDENLPKASRCQRTHLLQEIHTAGNRYEAMRQSQTVSSSALTPLEALRSSRLMAPMTKHKHMLRTRSHHGSTT